MAKRIDLEAVRDMQSPSHAGQSLNPDDRAHRPFIMDGDYPPRDAQEQVYPGVYEDQFIEEQTKREHALKDESGPLHGSYPAYPDRGMPDSPEMTEDARERQEYLRACHGGLPDAPEALPQPPAPFTGMKD